MLNLTMNLTLNLTLNLLLRLLEAHHERAHRSGDRLLDDQWRGERVDVLVRLRGHADRFNEPQAAIGRCDLGFCVEANQRPGRMRPFKLAADDFWRRDLSRRHVLVTKSVFDWMLSGHVVGELLKVKKCYQSGYFRT